ncbi:site-specific integrase [Streptomyces sp. NPDC014623]|uniref:site-specific integrase n=1 Tax=Streptomyces sp. NPDC014623 TaxID=3364875 RepID=UPI0037032DA4
MTTPSTVAPRRHRASHGGVPPVRLIWTGRVLKARQFLTATQGHRLHALFELALHTGLRKGELLGLHWEDLNLDVGTAAIRRTLQRTTAGGLTTLPTKTRASERRIALPTRCVHLLKLPPRAAAVRTGVFRHHVAGQRAHVHHPARQSDRPDQPHPRLHHVLRKAGLRRIRFHDLRHSTATLLLEQGVELVVIKELLGHAHIGVTATVYAHVRLRLQRDAIDTLSTALDSPENTKTARSDGDEPPPCTTLVR